MYANTKDRKVSISESVTATGIVETVDVRHTSRMFDEFAFQVAGRATKVINSTLLNGGFETAGGGGADTLANWAETAQGGGAVTQTAVAGEFHSGTKACKFAVDANGALVCAIDQDVMVIGHHYTLTLWAKGAAGGEVLEVYSQGTLLATLTLTNAYAQYTVTPFVADAAKLLIMSKADAVNNSAVLYIDDVVLTDTDGFERAPTDITADLEVSMDGVNWTSVKTVTEADNGVVKFVVDILVQMFRVNVSAITTGDNATDSVYVNVLAS